MPHRRLGFGPYCSADDWEAWDCGRGVTVGVTSLITLGWCLFALYRIYRSMVWEKWKINIFMLCLGGLLSLLMTIKYLMARTARLSFTATWLRALVTLMCCVAYAKAACELRKRPDQFRRCLLAAAGVGALFTVGFVIQVATPEASVGCKHPTFLALGIGELVLAVVAVAVGAVVNRELKALDHVGGGRGGGDAMAAAADAAARSEGLMDGGQAELAQARRQLWLLLVVNVFCAVIQVAESAWIASLGAGAGGDAHAGECLDRGDAGATVEFLRIVLRLIAFCLPVWAIVYVFYYLPRRQLRRFSESFDVAFDQLAET